MHTKRPMHTIRLNKLGPKYSAMFHTKFSCIMKQLTCPRSQATMSVIPFEMDIVKLGNTKGSKHRYQRKYWKKTKRKVKYTLRKNCISEPYNCKCNKIFQS